MAYLDEATTQFFYMVFLIIVIIFISILMLDLIANFFRSVFKINLSKHKKYDRD
jgi:competence protein ComGC